MENYTINNKKLTELLNKNEKELRARLWNAMPKYTVEEAQEIGRQCGYKAPKKTKARFLFDDY